MGGLQSPNCGRDEVLQQAGAAVGVPLPEHLRARCQSLPRDQHPHFPRRSHGESLTLLHATLRRQQLLRDVHHCLCCESGELLTPL